MVQVAPIHRMPQIVCLLPLTLVVSCLLCPSLPIVKKQYFASFLLPLASCIWSPYQPHAACRAATQIAIPLSQLLLETCTKYSSWKLCKILTLNLWHKSCATCSPWKWCKISEKSWLKFVLKSEPSFKVLVVEAGWCEGRGGVGSDTNVRFWLSARS